MQTMTNDTLLSITERAVALANEAAQEAEQYGRERYLAHVETAINTARVEVERALPEALALAEFTYDERLGTNDEPGVIVTIGDTIRMETNASGYLLTLALPCPVCGTIRKRGPVVTSMIELGIALTATFPTHGPDDSWDAGTGRYTDRCDGERRYTLPVPPIVVPPAPWRVERITSHEHLTETLNSLVADGYEPQWPPLMDGHVIAARLRGMA